MRHPRLFSALALISLMTACSVVSPSARNTYTIMPTAITMEAQSYKTHPSTLYVAPPRAIGGLNKDHIQVQAEDGHITQVSNAAWIEPPNKMLGPIVMQAFEQSKMFAHVVDDYTNADAGYELQTTIERFTLVKNNDTNAADTSHIDIALRTTLVKLPENKLLISKLIATTEPVDASHMSYVMTAFEKALARNISSLTAKIDTALAHTQNRR
jgi:hypothetical protein